jgi:hypothetical protein
MNETTVTLSTEALRRLQVEAACGRGQPIEWRYADRTSYTEGWSRVAEPCWDWVNCDYRVKPDSDTAKRDLLARIEAFLVELREQNGAAK